MRTRKQQYDCVQNLIIPNIQKNKHVFVTAPVKSGKRELVEIFARITDGSKYQTFVHYYVCNLNRKDCKNQIDELKAYGIIPIIANELKNFVEIGRAVDGILKNGHTVIFHIDESDYGSGHNQQLCNFLRNNYGKKKTHFIFYSATNEEVLFSNIKLDGEEVSFTPSDNYCGYDFFLDNNLVQNATQFFQDDMTLSNQAIDICTQHAKSNKQIGVVRLSTKQTGELSFFTRFKKDYKSHGLARKELEELYLKNNKKLQIVFVDQKNPFHWGTEETFPGSGFNHNILSKDYSLLIIINQTSTRSTQWNCHEKIFFYHSFRNLSTPANTILQADARCVHYNTSGNFEDSKIRIFSDVNVFNYYAKRMSADDLLLTGRSLSERVNQTSLNNKGRYKVKILIEDEDIVLTKNKKSISFNWTDPDGFERTITRFNYVSNTGSEKNVRKDNLAYDILNNIYSLSESYENKNAAARIDGARKDDATNTDWTQDWENLCAEYQQIEKNLKAGKKVFAVYYLDKNKTINTSEKSAYEHI